MVKVGVIGVGLQGQTHLKCYKALPDVEVVAISDVNPERLEEVGEQYGVPGRYTDYREMLKKESLDAVSVATPDHLHRDPVLACTEAKVNVLCEKPLATRVEDAEAMVKAAKDAGVKLMVNFSNRWMSYMAITKKAIEDGELGEPLYAYARLSNTIYVPTGMLKTWSSHTKLPFWLMSHTIDRVRWLFGGRAVKVYGVARSKVLKSIGIDTPDFYAALVEFDNGAVGNFESCWVLPNTRPSVVDSKMELVFTKGSVSIDAQQTMIQKATESSYTVPGTLFVDIYGTPVGFVMEAIRHFVKCVEEDREPWASGEDGLEVVRTCAAIVRSAETGRPVELS